jgi:type I restriction enzyme R subunit
MMDEPLIWYFRQLALTPVGGYLLREVIDDKFVEKFKGSKNPNLQIELLKRILSQEIGRVGKRNIVIGRAFSKMLGQSILRYQNRTLDVAQVVAELVALAKALHEEGERGSQLELSSDELAFYDAICAKANAVQGLSDDALKKIAHELVEIVRRDARTDWAGKEQVRDKLRTTIKRLLLKYGYLSDDEPTATQLVLKQAHVFAGEGINFL